MKALSGHIYLFNYILLIICQAPSVRQSTPAPAITDCQFIFLSIPIDVSNVFTLLDVRSLAVASRSRQSEKQPIVDELALIEHAHMGRSFHARRIVATCHG